MCTTAEPKLVVPCRVTKSRAQKNTCTLILKQVIIVLSHALITFQSRTLVPDSIIVKHVIIVIIRPHIHAAHDIIRPPLVRNSLNRVIPVCIEGFPEPENIHEYPLLHRIPPERFQVRALASDRAKLLRLEEVCHFFGWICHPPRVFT